METAKKKASTRRKVKAWRDRQKTEHPEKYKELKKTDKERKRKERLKIKQKALLDPEVKAALRKKKAEEMRKYRQRKKLNEGENTSAESEVKNSSKKTERVSLLQRKKEAVKRTQQWRLRVKLKETQTKQKSHDEVEPIQIELSRATVYRHVQKMKDALPLTPCKKGCHFKKKLLNLHQHLKLCLNRE